MTTSTHETNFNTKYLWIGLAALILIGAGIWLALDPATQSATPHSQQAAAVENGPANNLEPAPKAGHPAPDFTLTNTEGQAVSLSDFRGQPVIINFWATWCGPCRIEMPHLQEAFAENKGDVVVLGVNLTERDDPDAVPGFLEEFGLTFPVVFDEKGNVAKTYNVFGQPASVFVNPNGVVHEVFYGPINKNYIDTKITELTSS